MPGDYEFSDKEFIQQTPASRKFKEYLNSVLKNTEIPGVSEFSLKEFS